MVTISATFKFTLKKIARQIDELKIDSVRQYCRMYNISEINKELIGWYHFISFELFIEFAVNSMYFNFYYYVFIIELSKIGAFSSFLVITVIHVGSEIYQSIIRFSKVYFDLTKESNSKLDEMRVNWRDGFAGFMIGALSNSFSDNCTFIEWQTRHSIDMSMRFFAMISMFTMFLSQIFVIGRKGFYIETKNEYYTALLYLCSSFVIDTIYFWSIFWYNCKYKQFNIWKPFLFVYLSDYRVVLTIFIFGYFIFCFETSN